MKHHTITGGGSTRLHLVEAGDPEGPPILFLHGCSQSWLTWERQMRSELARRYRLVAMDLRGHGSSERPQDGYGDSRLWAADVEAAAGEKAKRAGDALWIYYPEGSGTSKLTPSTIDKAIGSPATSRNYRTVVKLKEMLES